MRFYLTYKDHGFYDPVVDDTEVIYIPVDPEQLEVVNVQRNIPERQPKLEKADFNQTGEPSTFVPHIKEEFLTDPDLEELPLLINVDEIPSGFKFRLPISETYDPEGNRVKVNKTKKEAEVIFNVKKILDEANEERIRLQQQAQDAVTEYISESKNNQNEEIKEDYIKTDEETNLNIIRDKALEVVNESIDKSISVAEQINENVTEINKSKDRTELITKELSKGFEEKIENVNIRKESIKNKEYDVNVSEEIQKFEKINTQTIESNIEERKLFTRQEIDETIQLGTVTQTSELFNKENNEDFKPHRIEINQNDDLIHTKRDESSHRESTAKQRAFSIGLKTIPHIRENINPLQIDYRLNLLTTFFLQLTNIMVTLSRFIAIEPKIYSAQDSYTQSQDERGFEKKKEKSKFDKSNKQTFESFEQHKEEQGLNKYKYEHVSDDLEGEIRKGKLSGAKIAQIEGRKTIELTDKMDTVISEFHKKTGFEEQSHDQSFRSHSGSRSKMKSEKNTFYDESQKQSHTDHRKSFKEFDEIKTQSLDISEMKSEKHSFESKTTKTEAKPHAHETTSTDGTNLTYVAIVEAHVYTNKDAIFEEQMKRKMEMKTQNIEQTKIETNQETAIEKLSLADTIIIPETVEISAIEFKDKINTIERAVTGVEQSTIKIAAKKISEVLEPLVELTSGRSHSVNHTHTIEEDHITGLSRKIYPSLEKPTKSVVEITEIKVEESESNDFEVLKLIVAKPKAILEESKPIAETIEISIKEDALAVFEESKAHVQKARQVEENIVKSVAETTEVITGSNIGMLISPEVLIKSSRSATEGAFKATAETLTILPEESKIDFLESKKIKGELAKVLIDENVSSEVFEVSLIEHREESLDEKKIKKEKPKLLLEESTLGVAQKSYISPVEPKSNIEIFTKVEKTANIKFDELKAVESTIIDVEEPGNNIFESPEIIKKYPHTSMEDPHLRIAQVYTILPDEPKHEHFEVSKITECKSSLDIVEIKAAETIITRSEEPKYERLDDLKIEKKVPDTTFEGSSLKVAETISMLSEEPKVEFCIPQFKNQQAGITMVEFKAAETTIVATEESKQSELIIEQPVEKKSKQIIEPSSLSVAIKTTEIVKKDEVGRSITPTSPTTPVVEEYMFALETELDRPYVVEEAVSEEASLRIKTQKKEIQSADTSFTLAIESIVESNSNTIEKIEEIEDIHLSKEVHESMFEGYNAKNVIGSHMSAKVEVKALDANQRMSTEAYSSHSHHIVSRKNETTMENAINISALEINKNVSTEAVNLESESISNQSRYASQSSLHKSMKMKSHESQSSIAQELQSSVTSMQSGSSEASNKAESSQYAESSNQQLSISKSTLIEGNIGLEAHQHLTASGSHEKAVSKSVETKSFGSIESASQLSSRVIKGESNASLIDEKLILQTDLKNTISNDGQSSTPQSVPPTPLTDEYIFRLQTKMPEESPFIPRDCSISPESMHEDVIVNGLLTNYKTKIDDRILYNPPLPTPPQSPEKAKPVYTKPGLKGGSERQELTKEEIHDSTLVSAIDRTLKQIEEYKASVGLTTEEMSYQQEDVDKEPSPTQIVEEWMDNEAFHNKTKNSEVEEIDAIKITVITEDNNAGETAVTVTTEGNVDDDGDDLEIQEISSNFDEISFEIEHDRILSGQSGTENKVEDFIPIQIETDDNLETHEEDYEWVAVHPSSLNRIGADDERETTNQFESKVLNTNAQETQTKDMSKKLVMLQDQEIIGEEAIIPPVESLKDSEVIKLLNEERTAVEERKWTTFLQKKYSPAPKTEVVYYGDFDIKTQVIPDAYRVKIVKQPKPKIAPDWKALQLKKESSPIIEISEPQTTEESEKEDQDRIEQGEEVIEEEKFIIEDENKLIEQEDKTIEEDTETDKVKEVIDKETEELDLEEMAQKNLAEELIQNVENMIDINASTDQQLEQMRDQLAALAQLPSVIQRTVELVHKRINLISQKEQQKKEEEEEYRRQEEERRREEEEHRRQEEEKREELERTKHSLEMRVRKTEEELAILMNEELKRRMIREGQQKKEKVELMKIDQESRKVTQRSNPRVGKPMSLFGPIQERPVILPGGRKWRTPEDVYDDEFITESLVGQAEVIKGTAIGVNFMKFDKPPPALDHLKHSEVFKAIHDIEQPIKKVELLGPVLSEADYKEKARSMSPCVEKVAEFTTKQSS